MKHFSRLMFCIPTEIKWTYLVYAKNNIDLIEPRLQSAIILTTKCDKDPKILLYLTFAINS